LMIKLSLWERAGIDAELTFGPIIFNQFEEVALERLIFQTTEGCPDPPRREPVSIPDRSYAVYPPARRCQCT
jgi:hypothetical protein